MKKTKLFVFLCSTFVFIVSSHWIHAQSQPGKNEAIDSTKYTIENCITKFSRARIELTEAGRFYWFADKGFAGGKTLKMSVVKPRLSTHPPHVHLEDEFFFILEGKAELYFKGRWTAVEPYTSLYCPSNVAHGIRNAGDTELKYLVIKKYENPNSSQE